MLASITPLGERSRGFSWGLTATAYALGALSAGCAGGALVGLLGSPAPWPDGWRPALALGVVLLAALIDGTPLRGRLPTTRRQVDESWLRSYRNWVYGFGFGVQLGLGVVTIVNSAAVYAAVALAFLAGGPLEGMAIGGAFGVAKGLLLVPAANARDPRRLRRLHRRLLALEADSRRAAPLAELAVAAAFAGGLLRW